MARDNQDDPKSKLIHDYAVATKHYAWAVGELDRQRAVLPKEHYQEMYFVAEDARRECNVYEKPSPIQVIRLTEACLTRESTGDTG